MKLPVKWGPGSIFAFSGLDGENTYQHSLVGTLTADQPGIIFHTAVRRELKFMLSGVADLNYTIVASDVIKAELTTRTGESVPLVLIFYTQDTVIGLTSSYAKPVLLCYDQSKPERPGAGKIVYSTGAEHTALLEVEDKRLLKFAFSLSHDSANDALNKAEQGLQTELAQQLDQKIGFFERLPRPAEQLPARIEKTLAKCYSVMKSQVYSAEGIFPGKWTTPDRLPHKKLWLWDSVFHALGNRFISPELARDSIKAVLSTQVASGFIPHLAFPPSERSAITQPPVLAWGIAQLYASDKNREFLAAGYRAVHQYLHWIMANRDSNRNYLYEWQVAADSVHCRCDESGMDNSPRFDQVVLMDCIDFSCFMANEARHMAKIAEILDLTDDWIYWKELYRQIKEAINTNLWDQEDGFYYDRILASGQLKKVRAISSFLPLFAGVATDYQAAELVKHLTDPNSFNTVLAIPSIAVADPTFGTDMWRGPVWINYNYMIAEGLKEYGYQQLAAEIIGKTIEAISFWYGHDGTIYEFYDCQDRVSPARLNRKGSPVEPYDFRIKMQNIRDYGWSSALFVAMVMEFY